TVPRWRSSEMLDQPLEWLYWTGLHVTGWKLIGYTGALMFGARWLVQFVASRRAGRPVIPRLFWYMSVAGSLMTLSYFLFSPMLDAVGALQATCPALTGRCRLPRDIRHRCWRGDWARL